MSKVASIRRFKDARSVFLSDVHLGFPGCSADYLCEFLAQIRCQNLYLVGDIIDFWHLRKRRHHWPRSHSRVIQLILQKPRLYLLPVVSRASEFTCES